MMMVGIEGCLMVYTEEAFQAMVTKRFADADMLDLKMSDVKRAIFPNTQEVEIDKQGRTAINTVLMTKCGMSKDIISIGLFDHFEIWDEERYEEHMSSVDVKSILASD